MEAEQAALEVKEGSLWKKTKILTKIHKALFPLKVANLA